MALYENVLATIECSVLAGNHYHKIQMFSNFYNLQIPCSTVFQAYQRHYICPAINTLYLKEQVCGYVPVAVYVSIFS